MHGSTPDEGSAPLNSLKERMTSAAEPSERAISSCPTGSWLDGLRTSFEPESLEQPRPEPSPKAKLLAGRVRSV